MPRDEHATLTLRLRDAAEHCITSLGTCLLRGDAGIRYFELIRDGRAECAEYFGQLRVLLLQIVAWMIGEQRGAVPRGDSAAVSTYNQWYCVRQLICPAPNNGADEHGPPWQRLRRVLAGLWQTDKAIGVTQWGADLFDPVHTGKIMHFSLEPEQTRALLAHVASALVQPCSTKTGADTQLLGCIHEWLMERRLVVDVSGRSVSLEACSGHERRTTGSYFTPAPLVERLLDVCLEPMLDSRVNQDEPDSSIQELLRLRIVDPACGTGVFLIAAAQRVASRIDSLERMLPRSTVGRCHSSLVDVVCQCLYGVDINPTTASLCRLVLWLACGEPFGPLPELRQHIRCGNSTLGAWPVFESVGIQDAAFEVSDGDDIAYARSLRARNRTERRCSQTRESCPPRQVTRTDEQSRFLADLLCAVFVWPKPAGADVPTHADFEWACQAPEEARLRWGQQVQTSAKQWGFFHWWLEFIDVLGARSEPTQSAKTIDSGFDLVIGNPPWVAYAGRATQPLHAGLKRFYCANYEAFAGFPTTHGIFIELATRLLGARGRIGLIVPASVADLAGYAPTRKAHDQRCRQVCPLPDFGEGRFTGVTQPCIALVSERSNRSANSEGAAWVLERSDLDQVGLALLDRMTQWRTFPEDLFGERGFQSTPPLRRFIRQQSRPEGEFNVALREGTDIREFRLGEVRHFANPCLFTRGLRPLGEFEKVALVVRQTARYPIAARNDGRAFRNSLLAVLHDARWPWSAMLCLLNSALFRWCHYYRFRDGRQPILPQLKVGHLRALPAPECRNTPEFVRLETLGVQLAERNQGVLDHERIIIDECVCKLYGLSAPEHRMITDWHAQRPR